MTNRFLSDKNLFRNLHWKTKIKHIIKIKINTQIFIRSVSEKIIKCSNYFFINSRGEEVIPKLKEKKKVNDNLGTFNITENKMQF